MSIFVFRCFSNFCVNGMGTFFPGKSSHEKLSSVLPCFLPRGFLGKTQKKFEWKQENVKIKIGYRDQCGSGLIDRNTEESTSTCKKFISEKCENLNAVEK